MMNYLVGKCKQVGMPNQIIVVQFFTFHQK